MSGSFVDESFKELVSPFPRKHVSSVLSAVLAAAATLKKKTETDHENWLTRRLHARLIQHSPFRDGPLNIAVQPEVNCEDIDADRPAGQIDIKVMCGKGAQVYFAIEAKRLRFCFPSGGFEAGAPEYVDNGMMRFVTGQYAPRMKSGAMLGYVFDGNVSAARDDIARAIDRRSDKLCLRQGIGLRQSTILPNHAVDETVHEPGTRELILYHLLVSV